MSISTHVAVVEKREVNKHGCVIYRGEAADVRIGIARGDTRYTYDEALCAAGWQQYDTKQDAYYFGKWVQVIERKMFCYAEGDRTLVTCPTPEAFAAELQDMAAFYGDPPPSFIVIDTAGRVTAVYDQRPTV
jgi:hypothetical protein